MASRLKKKDISLIEIYAISRKVYGREIDDKSKRSRLDTISGKVTKINNFEYDQFTHAWKSSNKRHVKFEFIVKTDPISYHDESTIRIHKYPVVFLLYDADLGLRSPFRWREGGFKRPLFTPKGANREKRIKTIDANIRNGTDMHFFYFLEWVGKQYGLLYGPCWATRAPHKTNPKLIPYFGKHALFIFNTLLRKILTGRNLDKVLKQVYKNEDRKTQS